MKELFFSTLLQTFFRMENTPSGLSNLKSSAFENYGDWYEHYRDQVTGLPDELPDEEIFSHWKKWALNFIDTIKNNENLINFTSDGIILYRALLLHGKEKIRFNSLGECWSVHPHTKVIFDDCAEEGADQHITLKAIVPLSAIDFEAVVEFFTHFYAFNEEGEVRLIKGHEIHIVVIGEESVEILGVV